MVLPEPDVVNDCHNRADGRIGTAHNDIHTLPILGALGTFEVDLDHVVGEVVLSTTTSPHERQITGWYWCVVSTRSLPRWKKPKKARLQTTQMSDLFGLSDWRRAVCILTRMGPVIRSRTLG